MESNTLELARETVKARGTYRLLKAVAGADAGITVDADKVYRSLIRELEQLPDWSEAMAQAETESREVSLLALVVRTQTGLGQLHTALDTITGVSIRPPCYYKEVEKIEDEKVRDAAHRLMDAIGRASNCGVVLQGLHELIGAVHTELLDGGKIVPTTEATGETTH